VKRSDIIKVAARLTQTLSAMMREGELVITSGLEMNLAMEAIGKATVAMAVSTFMSCITDDTKDEAVRHDLNAISNLLKEIIDNVMTGIIPSVIASRETVNQISLAKMAGSITEEQADEALRDLARTFGADVGRVQ
jgi:hypothetical protein